MRQVSNEEFLQEGQKFLRELQETIISVRNLQELRADMLSLSEGRGVDPGDWWALEERWRVGEEYLEWLLELRRRVMLHE